MGFINKNDMPRERLSRLGGDALSDYELLAIILSTGTKGENVIDLSRRIIGMNGLRGLAGRSVSSLKKEFGLGEAKACQICSCFELGRRLVVLNGNVKYKIKNAEDVARIFVPRMELLDKENLRGIFLDSKRGVIMDKLIFVGSLNESVIHPRDIFKIALEENAAAVILVHNHPSGDSTPSKDDIEATRSIMDAGEMIGVPVLDHVVIGGREYFSMKEKGLI